MRILTRIELRKRKLEILQYNLKRVIHIRKYPLFPFGNATFVIYFIIILSVIFGKSHFPNNERLENRLERSMLLLIFTEACSLNVVL